MRAAGRNGRNVVDGAVAVALVVGAALMLGCAKPTPGARASAASKAQPSSTVQAASTAAVASTAQPSSTAAVATRARPLEAGKPLHREKARGVLEVHCGLCHLPPEIGGGSGMALHIYDLTQDDWSATLSDAQLPIVEQKLVDDGADAAERAIIEQFVRDEVEWRDGHPALYSRALRDAPPRGP